MKRTITEIFIEVEETIAVRQTARIADAENEIRPAATNGAFVCSQRLKMFSIRIITKTVFSPCG